MGRLHKIAAMGMLTLGFALVPSAHGEIFAFCAVHNDVAWRGSDTIFRVSSQAVLDGAAASAFLKNVQQQGATLTGFLKHGNWDQATVKCFGFPSRPEALAYQKQAGPTAGHTYKSVGWYAWWYTDPAVQP